MDNNYQTENFLRTIKSMKDTDLMLAYKNRSDYNPEFVALLDEEMNIRGYDTTEIDTMSLEDIDVAAFKNKSNDELVKIYYKRGNYKTDWDIRAKNELENRGIDVEQQTGEKQSMFKGCFSFKGRIRRLEYGLSNLILTLYYAVVLYCSLVFIYRAEWLIAEWLIYVLLIPFYWFALSQGARRCHDLGHSGWWQLMPFYVLVMLFADGDLGKNKYGDNPKGEGNISY